MKLSEHTLSILKNFTSVNNRLCIKPGNVLDVLSDEDNVRARATVVETFPVEANIFDLGTLLSVVHGLKNSDLTFDQGHLEVHSSNAQVNFRYTDPRNIPVIPKVPAYKDYLSFKLEQSELSELLKFADILSLQHLRIFVEDGVLCFQAFDNKNPSGNTYTVKLDSSPVWKEPERKNFSLVFSRKNFRMIPHTYEVHIADRILSHFTYTDQESQLTLDYYITLEREGTVWK